MLLTKTNDLKMKLLSVFDRSKVIKNTGTIIRKMMRRAFFMSKLKKFKFISLFYWIIIYKIIKQNGINRISLCLKIPGGEVWLLGGKNRKVTKTYIPAGYK